MTRHPATEGNDLKPRKVDAIEDVSVAGRSIADAASGVYIQSDEPTDPPNGARWTDTSDSPPRTKIYDDSSGAWIPINAGDRTFVSETEPDDPLQGDIWFDQSPDDGVDMFWYNGDNWAFLQFIPALPELVADYEDETISPTPSNWSVTGDTTSVTISSNPSLVGDFSAESFANNEQTTIFYQRDSSYQPNEFWIDVSIENSNDLFDNNDFVLRSSSDNPVARLKFEPDENIYTSSDGGDGGDSLASWTPGTHYRLKYIFDWANEQVNYIIEDVESDSTIVDETRSFETSDSDILEIQLRNNASYNSDQNTHYYDDIRSEPL